MSSVSITDIARAAGVAPSTVSRALQGHPRISPARRSLIEQLALQMGYRPSQVARSLVTGRTRTLGVLVSDVTDPFVAEVMRGAELAARTGGYTLLFVSSQRDPYLEIEAAKLLLERQVDAMIVVSSRAAEHYRLLLSGEDIPVVLVNNDLHADHAFSVRMDNRGGAREAIIYLRALGHERIAFIAGPEGGRSSSERLAGYAEGIAVAGLAHLDKCIVPGSGLLEDGPRALSALLSSPSRPTAVLCYNDMAAIGLLSAAAAEGIRVPDELSVVGYDNIPMSAYTVPPLTTVDQPTQRMGTLAVDRCLTVLNGLETENALVEGQLVLRSSAGPPN